MKIQGEDQLFMPLPGSESATGSRPAVERANPDLWEACKDFEGLFLGYLVKSMQKTLPEGTLSSNGLPDVMFNQVMGAAMSRGGGIGLAEYLYGDLEPKVEQMDTDNEDESTLQNLYLRGVRKESHDATPSR